MNFIKSSAIFYQNCNAKNLSENTLDYYRFALKHFFEYAGKEEINNVEEVKPYLMIKYFSDIRNQYSKVTIKGKFVALNAFFKFLEEMEIINKNPMEKMEKPHVSRKIIYSFTRREVEEILSI